MKTTGALQRIVQFVAANPGCTRREILAAIGCNDPDSAMPTYCVKAGVIFRAGPRSSTRYYPTAEQAAAADAKVRAAVAERRAMLKRNAWARENLRKRAERAAKGSRLRNTRPGRMRVQLDPGVTLAPDVKITIAPPMRDRWA